MNATRAHLTLVLTSLSLLAMGCTQARTSTPNAEGPQGVFHHAELHQVSTREYRVDPPDEIIVKAPNVKELDGQKQKVRPDGKITLNLLGEVYVAGMTPNQINELLKKLVTRYYENPDLKVEVIAASKFYYVFGHGIVKQGRYAYTGRDTVVTALAQAGFDDDGWPDQVSVSRPGKNGQPNATAIVDFKKIFETGTMQQNYLLEEGDIIHVPFTPLAKFNKDMTDVLQPFFGATDVVGSATVVAQPQGAYAQ
jgi:polysaccharide export outer membrane protein